MANCRYSGVVECTRTYFIDPSPVFVAMLCSWQGIVLDGVQIRPTPQILPQGALEGALGSPLAWAKPPHLTPSILEMRRPWYRACAVGRGLNGWEHGASGRNCCTSTVEDASLHLQFCSCVGKWLHLVQLE
jgi:hypothetical protein